MAADFPWLKIHSGYLNLAKCFQEYDQPTHKHTHHDLVVEFFITIMNLSHWSLAHRRSSTFQRTNTKKDTNTIMIYYIMVYYSSQMSLSSSIKYISCRSEGMNSISYDFISLSPERVTCKLKNTKDITAWGEKQRIFKYLHQWGHSQSNVIKNNNFRINAEMHNGPVETDFLICPQYYRVKCWFHGGKSQASERLIWSSRHLEPSAQREMTLSPRHEQRGRIAHKIL